jgi:hypothetical protein
MTDAVPLVEEVVALGAALDFPINNESDPSVPPMPAPPGSTALLLACASLAMYGEMERRDPPNFRRTASAEVLDYVDSTFEFAIWLVHLGANCQVNLQLPAQRQDAPVNPKDHVTVHRIFKFAASGTDSCRNLARVAAQHVRPTLCVYTHARETQFPPAFGSAPPNVRFPRFGISYLERCHHLTALQDSCTVGSVSRQKAQGTVQTAQIQNQTSNRERLMCPVLQGMQGESHSYLQDLEHPSVVAFRG